LKNNHCRQGTKSQSFFLKNTNYLVGDGGFIAKFSDVTNTSSEWKAQTFYISPLADVNCVIESGTLRNSSSCSIAPTTGAKSYALHWEIPATWFLSDYDFSKWIYWEIIINFTLKILLNEQNKMYVDVGCLVNYKPNFCSRRRA
jgi:hypothetical protein